MRERDRQREAGLSDAAEGKTQKSIALEEQKNPEAASWCLYIFRQKILIARGEKSLSGCFVCR